MNKLKILNSNKENSNFIRTKTYWMDGCRCDWGRVTFLFWFSPP